MSEKKDWNRMTTEERKTSDPEKFRNWGDRDEPREGGTGSIPRTEKDGKIYDPYGPRRRS